MTHLTREQIGQLEALLRGRERRLRAEIREGLLRSGEQRARDIAGMVSDAGEEAVADVLADLEIAAVERDVGELQEVERALARVRKSDFGLCRDCAHPIGWPRLLALPSADRCHECQGRHEREFARPQSHSL